jgi:hypothetical protein
MPKRKFNSSRPAVEPAEDLDLARLDRIQGEAAAEGFQFVVELCEVIRANLGFAPLTCLACWKRVTDWDDGKFGDGSAAAVDPNRF